uniref:Furaquinocin biosynthesis prenyltransferase n=1 Tax=Streptomyces sp. (strain KO-3988) TaxID=285219 RepID=FUR7_STREO|nr:RecName: Full=Furaquinocin biosynthesis prenyltransferase; AltName: Full=6-linalyl-2-O,3-dimethylflaviolin synthase; AltName: Full=7-geranyloxy-5-hydroxy-2-methoxy-3-methylnaphthalene-1,4-dione synthase [Streptomyces sp. KO-3988]BAE78975.1 cloQ homologue [Streptomyces sp. KO-3988]BAF02319.1 prenyltransferase homolog [Streptomyces sp. KO-3988]
MPGTDDVAVDVASVYSAIEKSAGLLDVTAAREVVWPVLTAFEDVLEQAVIAFRVATNARHEGDFDVRFTVPEEVDPYAVALSRSLIAKTDHPVGSLLSDIQQLCSVDTYGVDLGVKSGFKKVWVYFPAGEHETLARLTGLTSMPGSLAGNVDFFTRYGLADKVDVIGIDYRSRTMNVYFAAPSECFERETVLAMHRDIGLPSPSEQMFKFCENSFGLYTTLNWDTMEIERISYGVKTENPMTFFARLGTKVEHFVKNVPYGVDTQKMVYAAVTSSGEEYYKLQSYYRWRSVSRLNAAYIAARDKEST